MYSEEWTNFLVHASCGCVFWSSLALLLLMAINKSMCELPVKRSSHKNVTVTVHSFAFGGRGVYFFTNRSRSYSFRATQSDCYATSKTCGKFLVFDPGILSAVFGLLMAAALAVLFSQMAFNATLGFPGEGPTSNWAKERLTVATWNSRSLTKERFDYCKNLNYDILTLTELWHKAPGYADGSVRWTYGQPQINSENDKLLYPNDPAGGVGILLSERAANMYMSHGSPCNRVTWVRLKGATANIFIVAVYMPHRARIKPAQDDTMQKLM